MRVRGGVAGLSLPRPPVFVNAYFFPGNQAAGTYFGLFPGQWLGTILLLIAMLMLSRVNRGVLGGEMGGGAAAFDGAMPARFVPKSTPRYFIIPG